VDQDRDGGVLSRDGGGGEDAQPAMKKPDAPAGQTARGRTDGSGLLGGRGALANMTPVWCERSGCALAAKLCVGMAGGRREQRDYGAGPTSRAR